MDDSVQILYEDRENSTDSKWSFLCLRIYIEKIDLKEVF